MRRPFRLCRPDGRRIAYATAEAESVIEASQVRNVGIAYQRGARDPAGHVTHRPGWAVPA